ncbi:MAG: HNH endonuclease [Patescibacteria group bacterium]|nr:HNH endonuclease [Patescibacteria group bacterium]
MFLEHYKHWSKISGEVWRDIPGYEGWYQASNLGRIKRTVDKRDGKRIVHEKILKPWKTKRKGKIRNLQISLSKEGKKQVFSVHHLILLTFIGPCPIGYEGCHNNSIPTDNRVVNLRWDNHINNCKDKRLAPVKNLFRVLNKPVEHTISNLDAVEYRSLANMEFPLHRVGNDGSYWAFRNNEWRQLKLWKQRDGYLLATLSHAGVSKRTYIHRLVLEAFIGPCPDGYEGCHKNGNKADNRLPNLRWDSRRGNYADNYQNGTVPCGIMNVHAKVNDLAVKDMRTMYYSREKTTGELAKIYGLDRTVVWSIVTRRTWKHVF